MCSIAGLIVLDGATPTSAALADEVRDMLAIGMQRGSDAFGVAVVSRAGVLSDWRGRDLPDHEVLERLIPADVASILAITRATPTTEWVSGQGLDDAQPFVAGGWVVVHNGTIANDRELAATLSEPPPSRVDSAVLPGLMAQVGFEAALRRVEGSFALAAVELARPQAIRLARNFKPICVARHAELPVVRFASIPEQLDRSEGDTSLDLDTPAIVRPDPYTIVELRSDGVHRSASLDGPRDGRRRRVLAVTSGGLDSTVAAAKAVADGAEVTLVHFTYGCHAQGAELAAVSAVGAALGCTVRVESLDRLGQLGASSLTTEGAEIAEAEAGAEFPHEWVPARNMLMLAYACAIADADRYDEIVLGTNLEEGGAYPDNTQEFIEEMSRAARLGTLQRTQIVAPLGDLVKHQIVELGVQLGAPLELSWSCYRPGPLHCGRCGPCFMRRVAFDMAGVPDPTSYQDELKRLRPVG